MSPPAKTKQQQQQLLGVPFIEANNHIHGRPFHVAIAKSFISEISSVREELTRYR